MFTYKILATAEVGNIRPGDDLYGLAEGEEIETFATEREAVSRGEDILNGLDGARDYNKALETANVIAVPAAVNG